MSSIRVRASFETVRLQAHRSGSQGVAVMEEFTSRPSYEPNYGPERVRVGRRLGPRPLTIVMVPPPTVPELSSNGRGSNTFHHHDGSGPPYSRPYGVGRREGWCAKRTNLRNSGLNLKRS